MKLVKVTCELKFSERMQLLPGYENMFTTLLKKNPEGLDKWLTPGLRLDDKERNRIMVLDPIRSVIDVEQPANTGSCRDLTLQFYKQLEEGFKIPQIGRWGLRATWIEECGVTFDDLLLRYKQKIFSSSPLMQKANDIAAVSDYDIGEGERITLTTGPMKLDQLKQCFTFKFESTATVFLYVDTDLGDSKTKQYSTKYLHEFFDKAIQEGEKLAAEVISTVGV